MRDVLWTLTGCVSLAALLVVPIVGAIVCRRRKLTWWTTLLLMLPLLYLVWVVAREPFLSVINGAVLRTILSGELLTSKFDIVHAGFVLDQPTIGKWLFWFSVATVLALPYVATVQWMSNRQNTAAYWAQAIPTLVIGFWLLCILTWPMCWLVQYISSMGATPRRIYGLIYGTVGALVVLAFLYWATSRRKAGRARHFLGAQAPSTTPRAGQAMAVIVTM